MNSMELQWLTDVADGFLLQILVSSPTFLLGCLAQSSAGQRLLSTNWPEDSVGGKSGFENGSLRKVYAIYDDWR